VGISPIGYSVGLLQLCIVDLCNIFELLDDMDFMHVFDKFNDEI
jgi:hypothetical protein